jgi:hypothetical protein
MKIIIKSLLIFSLTAIGFSCADPDLDPLQTEKVLKGTLLTLRGPQLDAIYFDGADYGDAFYYNAVTGTERFDYDAEFLAEDPASLESVDIFIIKEGSPDQRLLLTTIPGSSFKTDATYRGPWTSVSITLASMLTAIGETLSTPAGQSAFIAKYKDGIKMESDLNLKNGTKVLAADLVAAGLYESDQFYPAQFMTYGVENIDDARPVATTSLRGQFVKSASGTVTRPVLPLKSGARDTVNIVFDQKITTPPTVTINPLTAGTVGAVTVVGTTGKSFYVAFTAGGTYTGDVTFTISGATSGEAAPLTGLVQTTKTQNVAVDNLAPQKLTFTTGVIGKGQSATITLKFNEALGKAPRITVAPGTTGIDGATGTATLSADGLTATYSYEYKDLDGNATHGNAVVTVDNTPANKATDRAGNAVADITGPDDNLVIDLGPATAPTVTLDGAQYDWGTQIKWALSSAASPAAGGAKSGAIYYVAQTAGDAPPTGFVGGDVPAFILATGVTAQQTGSVAVGSSGNSGSVFSAFTPNGTLDVYVVHLSSTGVISAISAKTVVTMN